jgi:hypothetical protein
MIRMQVPRDEAKGEALIRGFLNLARTEHARGVAIEQQAQQDFWCDRFTPARGIAGINRAVVRGQTFAECAIGSRFLRNWRS